MTYLLSSGFDIDRKHDRKVAKHTQNIRNIRTHVSLKQTTKKSRNVTGYELFRMSPL